MDKVGIIIQARLGSSRLPGKILLDVCGKSFLEHLITRIKGVCPIIVATTLDPRDDPIILICNKLNVSVFRGSEEDVLDRTYKAASLHHLDVVVRITSDCPLMDPKIIQECLEQFKQEYPDYLSNVLERYLPRGMDVEIFKFSAIEKAAKEATESYDREHVTPYIKRIMRTFSVTGKADHPEYRLTLDTEEDLRLLQAIFESLYPKKPNFGLEEVMELLSLHPEWLEWNRHVKQKS